MIGHTRVRKASRGTVNLIPKFVQRSQLSSPSPIARGLAAVIHIHQSHKEKEGRERGRGRGQSICCSASQLAGRGRSVGSNTPNALDAHYGMRTPCRPDLSINTTWRARASLSMAPTYLKDEEKMYH